VNIEFEEIWKITLVAAQFELL